MQKRMLDFSQSPESRHWRTVRGYPDYLVGVDGRIYSKPRQVTRWRAGSGRETFTQAGMFLTPMKNTTGYYQVCLTNDDNRGRGGSENGYWFIVWLLMPGCLTRHLASLTLSTTLTVT